MMTSAARVGWTGVCVFCRELVAGRQSTARQLGYIEQVAMQSYGEQLVRGADVTTAVGFAVHDAQAALARLLAA